MRITISVDRDAPITVVLDGESLTCYSGETVAALLLERHPCGLRVDSRGAPRSLFCNMGTCSECFVAVSGADGETHRLRACMTYVEDGMHITTDIFR